MKLKLLFTLLFLTAIEIVGQWTLTQNNLLGDTNRDVFGKSVSISGDGSRIIVGAPQNDGAEHGKGYIRVFDKNTGEYLQLGSDIIGDNLGDEFGFSVDISNDGNIIAVGAPLNDGSTPYSNIGSVKIYQYISSNWVQLGSEIIGEATGDEFGYSVSLNSTGNIIAIGARRNDTDGVGYDNDGHVKVYQLESGNWSQIGNDIDGTDGKQYGASVSISDDGNILVMGSQINGAGAKVFENNAGNWQQVGSELLGASSSEGFGNEVDISGDGEIIAIGAPNSSGTGYVKIYKKSAGSWSQIGATISSDQGRDSFGKSLSLSFDGDVIAVGAPFNSNPYSNSGSVKIFINENDIWSQIDNEIESIEANDYRRQIGSSVSLSSNGTILAIGVPELNGTGFGSAGPGMIRVYENDSFIPNPFITKWKTTAANELLWIPLTSNSKNFTIDWGDGNSEFFEYWGSPYNNIRHTYQSAGEYIIKISGEVAGIEFTYLSNAQKLLEVLNWGNVEWSEKLSFAKCTNMDITALDTPDLTSLTSLEEAFYTCYALVGNNSFKNWDVSSITNMHKMFANTDNFNQDISTWDISNVTNLSSMFYSSKVFNQNIGSWDTNKVADMSEIFSYATNFNQDIGNWDTSKVTDMSEMFYNATNFNQDIGGWDTSSVSGISSVFTDAMYRMFNGAIKFNQDISSWDTSKVTSMMGMFSGATSFNQNLGVWDISNVVYVEEMFSGAINFNQDISSWDISKVTSLANIFKGATKFNKNLNSWDTSSITFMSGVFSGATNFNQDISSWDTSNVTYMTRMFEEATSFNQDISSWDVGEVKYMASMFEGATNFNQNISNWQVDKCLDTKEMFLNANSFNQDLSNWNIGKVYTMLSMFDNSGISVINYDKTLKGWSALSSLKSNINLGALNINYCNSETERTKLINDYNWTFTGDSKDCSSINTPTNVDGMWNDPANWSNGVVPSATDNVVIPATTTLQISADISEVNSLENEGTIIINPTFSLKSMSNMVNNGTIVMDSDNGDSSVLFIEGTSTGEVVYKRGGLIANKWSLVTPPVSGQKIKEFATNTDNDIRTNETVSPVRYAVGFYDDSQDLGNEWVYYDTSIDENQTFTAGQSYAISRATDGAVSFTGTLTTSNLTRTLQPGEWNAIGNPFTTYYPANKNGASSFINDNYDILDDNFKGIYVWDNTQNKYVAASETDIENKSLTPGQGFFIKVKEGEFEIDFNEAKRTLKPVTGDTDFNKTQQKYIQLFADNGSNKVETNIKFFQNATNGFDVGLDIGNFDASFDLFTKLVDFSNAKNYTIQSLPNELNEDMIIPLGVSANNMEVVFSAKHLNLEQTTSLYLEDKITKSFVDITNENDTYTVNFSDSDITKDRFYLHILPNKSLYVESNIYDNLKMYANNKILYVRGLKTVSKMEIFNTIGQKVFVKSLSSDEDIDLSNLKTGVYTIKLNSNNSNFVKKVILN
ncbi:BspA family leucine-rich repeat surface protein [Polaribacter sp. Asnod6-C07]|uniref:BspA family leucine-rich repeat surface protein n=1 Tax=Polaribacter sp. Asnod6-C07 TaxID=3160582 RepID=UPI0038645CE5